MMRVELEKLLGGYAAGTLTPAERRALFEAALTDQTLFDALADEEALRDVLADPLSRERVLLALVEQPPTVFESLDVWMRRHPVWALASVVMAAAMLFVVIGQTGAFRKQPAKRQIAMVRRPVRPQFQAPAPQQQRSAPSSKPAAGNAPHFVTPPARQAPRAPAAAENRASAAVAGPAPAPARAKKDAAPPPPPPPPPPPSAAPAVVAQSRSNTAPPPQSAQETVTVNAEAAKVAEAESPRGDRTAQASSASAFALNGRDAGSLQKIHAPEGKVKGEAEFGLRYAVALPGADEKQLEVSHRGSMVVRFEVDQSGYLYVLAGGKALFTGPVAPDKPVSIDAAPGTLHVVLLPAPDDGPISTLVRRTRRKLAGARLQVEKSDESVYIANPSPAPATGIVTEISIPSR